VASAKAVLELVRWKNSVLTVVAVFVGALAAQLSILGNLENLAIAFVSALLIVSGGFVINNYYDAPWDAKTEGGKKKNPIARGDISSKVAEYLAVILFCAGFFVAIVSLNELIIFLATINSLLEYAYSKWFKPHLALVGNVVLSYLTGSAYLYGLFALRTFSFTALSGVLFMLGMSVLASMGREAIKSIPDIGEDKARTPPLKTFAIRFGIKNATVAATIFLLVAILLSPIPYILGIFGTLYLGSVILVDSLLFALGLFLFLETSPENAQKVKEYVLYVMGIGIIAFGLGVIQVPLTITQSLLLASICVGITPLITLLVAVSLIPKSTKFVQIEE
jgi:geranylgeranylglycerol-phosphate geranylgeranyltransferase